MTAASVRLDLRKLETAGAALFPRLRLESTGCVVWTGTRSVDGYGRVYRDGRDNRVHRLAWEAQVGPIPEGLQIDHLCRNRPCLNPAHLEVVTLAENIRRGDTGSTHRNKTHCPFGHEYTALNTCRLRRDGSRRCRTCNRDREARRRRTLAP